jgi:hypothetical protein
MTKNKHSFINLICLLFTSLFFGQAGTLDNTFGIRGKVSNNLGPNNWVSDSVLQNDGKIIVVGNTYSYAPGSSFSVVRYLSN